MIDELRAMAVDIIPPPVLQVLHAVCHVFRATRSSANVRNLLFKEDFLQRLKSVEPENVDRATIVMLE
jgi:hypothetical protein